MAEVNRVIVKIEGDIDDFKAKMLVVNNTIKSFGSNYEKAQRKISRSSKRVGTDLARIGKAQRKNEASFIRSNKKIVKSIHGISGALKLMRTALVVAASVGIASRGIGSALETQESFSKSVSRIKFLTKETGNYKEVLNDLIGVSRRTGIGIGELTQLYARFGMASKRFGVSQKELLGITQLVGDTFRISGSTMQEATGSAIQFAQAIASNRLGGEELRSVMENNIRLTSLLADELSGGDLGKFRADAKAGNIDTQSMLEAMLKNLKKIRAEAKEIPLTLNEGVKVSSQLFGLGFSEGAKDGFDRLANLLNSAKSGNSFRVIGRTFGEIAGKIADIVSSFKTWLNGSTPLANNLRVVSALMSTTMKDIISSAKNSETLKLMFAGIRELLLDVVELIPALSGGLLAMSKTVGFIAKKIQDMATAWTLVFGGGGAVSVDAASIKELDKLRKEIESRTKNFKKVHGALADFVVVNFKKIDKEVFLKQQATQINQLINTYNSLVEVQKKVSKPLTLTVHPSRVEDVVTDKGGGEVKGGGKGKGGKVIYPPPAKIREANKELEQYIKNIKDVHGTIDKFSVSFVQGAEDAFVGIIDGTKSVKDSFTDLADSVISDLTRMFVQQNITKGLAGFLNIGVNSGKVGGGGGNSIFGDIAGAFFGGFRADGGTVNAGTPYMVGERGREMFVPTQAGTIVPNGGMGGGGNVNVNIINTAGVDVDIKKTRSPRGLTLEVMIDKAVAGNIKNPRSQTSNALRTTTTSNQILTGRG